MSLDRWPPVGPHDPCSGGHPGGTYVDEHGVVRCPRCGRFVDLTPCWCGEHEPGSRQGRSFCQRGVQQDQMASKRTCWRCRERLGDPRPFRGARAGVGR